ncbi:MAG: hypothetical protein JWO67_2070, partial [Streptosporangiaceae bacterium]|nr:hypothetical protein [Streptosporangiaceae bacterium]
MERVAGTSLVPCRSVVVLIIRSPAGGPVVGPCLDRSHATPHTRSAETYTVALALLGDFVTVLQHAP